MQILQDISELRKALNQRMIKRQLRLRGIGSILFGVLALASGGLSINLHPLNAFLAFLGAFLLIQGILLLAAPSARGFILGGYAMAILGAWNIFATAVGIPSRVESGTRYFLGILQIYWGIKGVSLYNRASDALSVTISQETIQSVDDLISTVRNTSSEANPNCISIYQTSFPSQYWRCLFMDDIAVLVSLKNGDAVIARKDEFILTQKGKHSPGMTLNATLQVDDRKMSVEIYSDYLERLLEWKPGIV